MGEVVYLISQDERGEMATATKNEKGKVTVQLKGNQQIVGDTQEPRVKVKTRPSKFKSFIWIIKWVLRIILIVYFIFGVLGLRFEGKIMRVPGTFDIQIGEMFQSSVENESLDLPLRTTGKELLDEGDLPPLLKRGEK